MGVEVGLIAKVGGGLACLTGVTVGGCYAGGVFGGKQYGAKKKSVWREKSATTWDPLEAEKNDYAKGQIGKLYGRYLLGIYGNEQNKQLQKKQWEGLYSSREEGDFGESKFMKEESVKVKQAYAESGDNSSEGLNVMCAKLYGKTFEELKQEEEKSNTEYKIKNDLFKYCSTISSKPSTIVASNVNDHGGNASLISEWTGKGLVVIEDSSKPFWSLQDRWFKALNDEVTDPLFKKHQEKNSEDNLDVMRACDAAYKTPKTDSNPPKIEDVVKYCTFAINSQ